MADVSEILRQLDELAVKCLDDGTPYVFSRMQVLAFDAAACIRAYQREVGELKEAKRLMERMVEAHRHGVVLSGGGPDGNGQYNVMLAMQQFLSAPDNGRESQS